MRKNYNYIVVIIIVAVISVLTMPLESHGMGFNIVSQYYRETHDDWSPWGATSDTSGDFSAYAGNNFYAHAVASAYGLMQCSGWPWCAGYGAGGWERWDFAYGLQLTGQAGTEADVYLDLRFTGWTDVMAFGVGNSYASTIFTLNTELPNSETLRHDSWYKEADYAEVYLDKKYTHDDSYYVGRMIVGDPQLGTLWVWGNLTGYANCYNDFSGMYEADMVAGLELTVTPYEVSVPVPAVPEPSTILLLGSGLLGILGFRRKFRK